MDLRNRWYNLCEQLAFDNNPSGDTSWYDIGLIASYPASDTRTEALIVFASLYQLGVKMD